MFIFRFIFVCILYAAGIEANECTPHACTGKTGGPDTENIKFVTNSGANLGKPSLGLTWKASGLPATKIEDKKVSYEKFLDFHSCSWTISELKLCVEKALPRRLP